MRIWSWVRHRRRLIAVPQETLDRLAAQAREPVAIRQRRLHQARSRVGSHWTVAHTVPQPQVRPFPIRPFPTRSQEQHI